MRNLHLEAAIWSLFTSVEFFEAAVLKSEQAMKWFERLAISRQTANFGRNNQIFDKLKRLATDFKRGAELARLGDYRLIWETAGSVSGDVRGIMEQPLHSWMSEAEYQEFSSEKIGSLLAYAGLIENALNNAMVAADSFYEPDPDCPERSNDDDGFPGDDIVNWYADYVKRSKKSPCLRLPDPLPEYGINTSIACRTGEDVPRTGVWYPSTGLEQHSLTFAIEGSRMQPAFRVAKTREELKAEGVLCPYPETVAIATTWHPVVPSGRQIEPIKELWAKAGQPCPKAGIWQPTEPGAAERTYEMGEKMLDLCSAYGFTMWRWIAD